MPPGSPSSRGIRGFIKRSVGNVKEALGSQAKTPDPHSPSPQHQPSPGVPSVQLTPAPEHPSSPPARSQQPTPLSQPALSPGRPGSTTSLVTAGSVQSADGVSTLAQVGEDVWTGLKGALQLLERSSDAFPPLKSAGAGFLGVVNVFEASGLDLRVVSLCLFDFVYRLPPRTGETTSGSRQTCRVWSWSSPIDQGSNRHPGCWQL